MIEMLLTLFGPTALLAPIALTTVLADLPHSLH